MLSGFLRSLPLKGAYLTMLQQSSRKLIPSFPGTFGEQAVDFRAKRTGFHILRLAHAEFKCKWQGAGIFQESFEGAGAEATPGGAVPHFQREVFDLSLAR